MLLIIATMLFLTACSSGNNSGTDNAQQSSSEENTVELTVAFPVVGTIPSDLPLVQNAVNEITKQKIKATVKFTPISAANWTQQMNLMLTGGEKLDLFVVLGNYSQLMAQGQIISLNKLIDEHGQGIKTVLDPDFLNAAKIKGEIYGIPTIRNFASSQGILMPKELVDKYQIDMNKIQNVDDVEAAFKTFKKDEPNIDPLVPALGGLSHLDGFIRYDKLGDRIGVLPDYDNNLKVVNLYETEEYAQLLKKMREWYTSGLILKDASTNKSSQYDLIKAKRAIAYMPAMRPGIEQGESRMMNMPMVSATLIPPVATTSTVTNVLWGIPSSSKLSEKAMEFLNLLYTDKEIVNLLDWGIEGKHYVLDENQVVSLPPGVTAENSGFSWDVGWIFGNQFLSHIPNGSDPKLWEQTEEFNKSAIKSKALGFTFDLSSVKTEYAAVSNAINQYKLPLETGSVDPNKILPEFIAKLKSAGIDKIIAEKQKQLDEWAQKK